MTEIIEILDAAPIVIEIRESGPQGPAGPGMGPVDDQTLIGNASGALATPVALPASQVRDLLNVPSTSDMQSAVPVLTAEWIASLPSVFPDSPNQFWMDSEGRLTLTKPLAFDPNGWNDNGIWYDSQVWSDE